MTETIKNKQQQQQQKEPQWTGWKIGDLKGRERKKKKKYYTSGLKKQERKEKKQEVNRARYFSEVKNFGTSCKMWSTYKQ